MSSNQYLNKIVDELKEISNFIPDEDGKKITDKILNSKKIFVTGLGRSGFMGKAFVMRLMHMGFDSYVIGETTTPNFESGDLLIVGSGSGETSTLIPIVNKAKSLGGVIALVTVSPESTIAKLSDIVIKIPAAKKDGTNKKCSTIQPMGSLFEQTMLLFYDSIILRIMKLKKLDSNKMYGKHANLE